MSMLCASDPTGRAFASKIEMRLERPIGVQNLENRFGANHVQDVIFIFINSDAIVRPSLSIRI